MKITEDVRAYAAKMGVGEAEAIQIGMAEKAEEFKAKGGRRIILCSPIPPAWSTNMNESLIRLKLEPLDEGGYVATSPDVPGLVAEGRSMTEAVEIAQGLARKIAESCLEHGDPFPPALAGAVHGGTVEAVVPVGIS